MDNHPALIAFAPIDGGPAVGFLSSVTIAATTSASAVTQLPGSYSTSLTAAPQNVVTFKQIQIANQTSGWIFVNAGTASIAAATVAAGYPVSPGGVVIITVNGTCDYVSVICAVGSSGGSVTFTRGQGL